MAKAMAKTKEKAHPYQEHIDALRKKCERNKQGGEQHEEQTQAIDADEIFGADGGYPAMTFNELEPDSAKIKLPPQQHGACSRDSVANEGDRARILMRPAPDGERPKEWNENQRADYPNHA